MQETKNFPQQLFMKHSSSCDNQDFSVTEIAYHNKNRRILLEGVFSDISGTSSMKWNNNNNNVTSQTLINLFWPRLIVSSKVLQVVFIHLVYNSGLFLVSCCCSHLLHVVANLICIFLCLTNKCTKYMLTLISYNSNMFQYLCTIIRQLFVC